MITIKHFCFVLFLCMLCRCTTPEHSRETINFNANWKFTLADSISDYSQEQLNDQSWRTLNLPHDWSIESDFSDANPATPGGGALPGGIGWYRKTFTIDAHHSQQQVYIQFDGIYWNSTVWINGHKVGFRPNGYISFQYNLTPYIHRGAKNTIAVKVDNSQQPNSRWYSGSGIYRNVRLLYTHPIHISQWGVYVTTPQVTNGEATVNIAISIDSLSALKNNTLTLQNTLVDSAGKTVAQSTGTATLQTLKVSHPQLWDTDHPYCYTLKTILFLNGKPIDSYTTPVGIRTFKFDSENGFILNGKSVKINGVCNHHDLGCLGVAVNTRAIERQLQILKNMGCNGIRCSHNPPSPELLQLCDKMGFIVMDEAFDMWRKRKTVHDYSHYFPQWYERDLRDQILRDRNHPSVFIWSIGNEVLEQWQDAGTDTLSLKEANVLLNQKKQDNTNASNSEKAHFNSQLTTHLCAIVKSLDTTRPISAGCNEPSTNNLLFKSNSLDLIGFNYHTQNYASISQNFPHKAFIATETVSALMSRGYYLNPSTTVHLWPESWDKPFDRPVHQCSSYDNCHAPWGNTHEESLQYVKTMKNISGQYVWTGFDYLGEPTPFWWPSRSSYFGIIDLAGFPKDIYYLYQSEWSTKDVLHIFPHWNWVEGDTVDIVAYYNHADQVELFLNGKSLGAKHKEGSAMHVYWRVPFHAGTLTAISQKDGKQICTQSISTTGVARSIKLTADRSVIQANGTDLSYITVEVLDQEGRVVPTAQNLVHFNITGPGIIAGTDNGDATDHASLKKHDRALFNGKALVVVQSKRTSGTITIEAVSPHLKSCSLKLLTN